MPGWNLAKAKVSLIFLLMDITRSKRSGVASFMALLICNVCIHSVPKSSILFGIFFMSKPYSFSEVLYGSLLAFWHRYHIVQFLNAYFSDWIRLKNMIVSLIHKPCS